MDSDVSDLTERFPPGSQQATVLDAEEGASDPASESIGGLTKPGEAAAAVEPSAPRLSSDDRDLTTRAGGSTVLLNAFAEQSQLTKTKTLWRKFRNGAPQFAKDFGPLFVGVAGILASFAVGLATVSIALLTLQSNNRQAELNQTNLKTTALTDFTEVDPGKRTLAAIKLTAYGDEALPAIKLALGVGNDRIRSGGVETAQVMYESRPDCRASLLNQMLTSFQDSNPTLRLGVLQFYSKTAPELTADEKLSFLKLLTARLGAQAQLCSDEEGQFMLEAAAFLSNIPFKEGKDSLLGIARNCPVGEKFEGARVQAVSMIALVVEEQRPPQHDREAVVGELRQLKTDDSTLVMRNVESSIIRIERVEGP